MVPPMGALAVGGGTPRYDRAQSPPHCLDGPSAADGRGGRLRKTIGSPQCEWKLEVDLGSTVSSHPSRFSSHSSSFTHRAERSPRHCFIRDWHQAIPGTRRRAAALDFVQTAANLIQNGQSLPTPALVLLSTAMAGPACLRRPETRVRRRAQRLPVPICPAQPASTQPRASPCRCSYTVCGRWAGQTVAATPAGRQIHRWYQ